MHYLGKISKEEIMRMNRKASRDEQIDNGNKNHGHKVHKSKKQYDRQRKPAHHYLNNNEDF